MAKKTETKTDKIERTYVIPLREKFRRTPRYKKANKAVKSIKEFLVKHMKIYDRDLKKIKLDTYLNEFVWFRGIKKPPAKIKVKAIKEGDIVRVELAEMPNKFKFRKLREEKRDKKAKEIIEGKKSMMEKAKEQLKPKEGTKPSEDSAEKEEKKAEETEKKSAVVEAGNKLEKDAAKKMKHQTKQNAKQPKRPVRQAMAK